MTAGKFTRRKKCADEDHSDHRHTSINEHE